MRTIVFAISMLATVYAFGQEFKPYPTAKITESQWHSYFQEVSEKHGATRQELPEQKLILFSSKELGTYFAFTMPGSPAHPAWVTRRLVQGEDGLFRVAQIGYFAGEEAAFAKLFSAYAALNDRMIEASRRKKQQKAE